MNPNNRFTRSMARSLTQIAEHTAIIATPLTRGRPRAERPTPTIDVDEVRKALEDPQH